MTLYHHIRKILTPLVGLLLLLPLQNGISRGEGMDENDVTFIASLDVFESTLSSKDIRDIFLGKKCKWTDGKEIIIAVMYQTEAHQQFTKKYTRKTSAQFMTYWKHMVFIGQGRFPKSIASETEMIDFVAKSHGVIGYVSKLPLNEKRVKPIELSD